MEGSTAGASMLLLAAFLVVGLVVYERRALRLGGVLVMPLLVVYALLDLSVLPVFFLAGAIAFAAGEWVHKATLMYGRRIFVVYLLLGIAATFAGGLALGVGQESLLMAVLPGLFAFNLHREGSALRGASVFAAFLGAFLLAGTVALLVAGVHTDGVLVLGPPMVTAVVLLMDLGTVLPGLLAGHAPMVLEAARIASEEAIGTTTYLPMDATLAAVGGLPGAGGLSLLGLLDALFGGGSE